VILALGDSKSAPDTQIWGYTLANLLSTSTQNPWRGIELGRGGYTLDKLDNNLTTDADVYGHSIFAGAEGLCETASSALVRCPESLRGLDPTYVLVNVGVNDVGFVPPWALPDQTTWTNDYLSVLDKIHAQWPDALVPITKPWKRQSGGDETLFDTMAGWIDDIVAARPAFAFVADDERSWFKPNPSLYSDDNIHFNTAGQTKAAQEKLAVLP